MRPNVAFGASNAPKAAFGASNAPKATLGRMRRELGPELAVEAFGRLVEGA